MKRTQIVVGILLILILLTAHLLIINDYGLTWDFHFHFFSGANFFGLKPMDVEPRALPYVEPDPRNAIRLPYGPFVQIVPFASWLLFYKNLNILPYDVAYNLPIVIAGTLGIGVLYFFLSEAINWKIGLIAAIFLMFTPRYFADLHNNMKDAPMAAVFALNIWMLWRLVKYRRLKDLIFAAIAFALAFNTKINSIFIPAIFAMWLLLLNSINPKHEIRSTKQIQNPNVQNSKRFGHWSASWRMVIGYFVLAPLSAFLLWWFFWGDPIGQLKLAVSTFGGGADNIEVLLGGKWFCAGSTVPWYYPFWYLAITTPLPILAFFLIGLGYINVQLFQRLNKFEARNSKHETNSNDQNSNVQNVLNLKHLNLGFVSDFDIRISNLYILFLLWFFLPLTRYLLPNIAVIDGVRHFEEVLFPLAAIAAIGATKTITWLHHLRSHKSNAICVAVATIKTILFSGILILLTAPIIQYHPFQISYYNELAGGIRGAWGKYDLDYWGSSQKKATNWLNANAEKNATVTIVMAGNVAGIYLRPDLLTHLNTQTYETSDYVIILNRQSFFYRFFYTFDYLLTHKPIHTIDVNGVPLVWIFDNRLPKIPRQTQWWQGEDPCIRKYW